MPDVFSINVAYEGRIFIYIYIQRTTKNALSVVTEQGKNIKIENIT